MDKVVKTEEIYELEVAKVELHPLAKSTPVMNDDNYTALKLDIELNGQLEPVTLYRGRIVDGRHRWMILQELEVKHIKAIKLPHNTSAAKLKSIVRSKEIRRHESPAQLAISAYRLMTDSDKPMTAQDAAQLVGADRRKVGEVKKIIKEYQRPDIIDALFDGEYFDIGTVYDPRPVNNLPAIIKWLKENGKSGKPTDKRGEVEMTEDQFKECGEKLHELKGLDMKQIKHISKKLYFHIKEYEEGKGE